MAMASLFDDSAFFLNLFNAIPSPVLVVDNDVRILHLNSAAAGLMPAGKGSESIYLKRGGDALHCMHAGETPEGCGHASACADCVIRNSVNEAISGEKVYRKKTMMELSTEQGIRNVHVLVTTSPFRFDNRDFSLLIIEDISELLQLRSLLPICAWCKKIRDDDNYWQSVENYFGTHMDITFSHGICEDCSKKFYEELER
ncbi:MAG: hypothetical protein HZB62_14845 [Nitrospirae bacterium]|nr:hypothetical protein [Nitrospirota bacterium]